MPGDAEMEREMYCRNCGNPLLDSDKFCSRCGTPVKVPEPPKEDFFVKTVEKPDPAPVEIKPPGEELDWNIHNFPGQEPKKTASLDFDWNVGADFRGKRINEPKEEQGFTSTQRERRYGLNVNRVDEPFFKTATAEAPWRKEPLQEEPKVEAPTVELGGDLAEKKTPLADVVYEPPKAEKIVGPKMWKPPVKAELPEDDSLENFTPPTPEEFGQLGEDKGNLAEQTEKIDKFYTFNKKNEEFQKLLDKEYEKFKREGRGDMPFMEGGDVSTHKGSEGADFHVGPTPPEEMAGRKPSQIEEMHRARATFFGEFEELKITSSGKSAAGTAEAVAGGEAPEAELITEEKLRTLQEGANSAGKLGEASVGSQGDTSGVAPVQVTEEGSPSVVEPSTAGENKNRSSIAGKVIIIICSIILVLALAVLGIKFLAPNSAAASKIDSITNGIMNMFSGYAAEPEFISSDRSVPIEDKTGLIQLSLDQNHNEAIGAIRYNASLAYKEGVAYPDKDITGAKPMTENAWYAGEDETVYFLDQGLVATIIDYESRIAENEKATETFNTLDIGEIRIGEKGYYVWIAEYKTDANKENATTKKVCRVVVDGNKMNVEEVYTL